MKEARIRKAHRTTGIVVALFILLQTVTGIVLTIENIADTYWGGIIHDLLQDFGLAGNVYRLTLGLGLIWMVGTGGLIYRSILRRRKR